MMDHKDHLPYVDMDILVEDLGNLRYDSLSDFLYYLSLKIHKDSAKDRERGRPLLSNSLEEASILIKEAGASIEEAWKICEPYMPKDEEK